MADNEHPHWPARAVATAQTNGHNGGPHNGHPPINALLAPPTAPRPAIDYTAVRTLRTRVSKELTEALRDLADVSTEYRQAEGERIAARLVRDHADARMQAGEPVSPAEEQALLDAVAADMFGVGRLQHLLDQHDIVNIHILGCDQVRIERTDGRITYGDPVADSDEELISMLQVLAMRAGATERSLSATKPWLDMQLPDGSRLTVVYQVAVRPLVAIRRHTLTDITLEELRDKYGAIDDLVCQFLKASMAAGFNIMVAGARRRGQDHHAACPGQRNP